MVAFHKRLLDLKIWNNSFDFLCKLLCNQMVRQKIASQTGLVLESKVSEFRQIENLTEWATIEDILKTNSYGWPDTLKELDDIIATILAELPTRRDTGDSANSLSVLELAAKLRPRLSSEHHALIDQLIASKVTSLRGTQGIKLHVSFFLVTLVTLGFDTDRSTASSTTRTFLISLFRRTRPSR